MSTVLIPKQDITITPVLAPYIIEITQNGTEWYKIWSNGWVEQGGYFKGLYGGTVTLPIPMRDEKYALFTSKYSGDYNSSSYVINTYNKTSKSFVVKGRGQGGRGYGSSATGHWYVCGYMKSYTLTLKYSENYSWKVNGVNTPAGSYVKLANTKLEVEAVPKPNVEKLRSITMTVE